MSEIRKLREEKRAARIFQANNVEIKDISTCYHCKKPDLKEEEVFCENCGFPQRGDKVQQINFVRKYKSLALINEEYGASMKKARNILYILAGINLIAGILMGLVMENDLAVLVTCILAAGIYLGLGLWSRTNPFPAIVTGLIVYITFIVIAAVFNPMSIFSGIIWKVLIISGFVYGYKAAKEAEAIKEQLNLKGSGAVRVEPE